VAVAAALPQPVTEWRAPGTLKRRGLVKQWWARVGKGPILRSGENQKAPTMYRPSNRSNNDATFIVLQERDDFCGVRVVPIGKLLEKSTAGRQVGSGQCSTAECPSAS
jgi:hypothetical protein